MPNSVQQRMRADADARRGGSRRVARSKTTDWRAPDAGEKPRTVATLDLRRRDVERSGTSPQASATRDPRARLRGDATEKRRRDDCDGCEDPRRDDPEELYVTVRDASGQERQRQKMRKAGKFQEGPHAIGADIVPVASRRLDGVEAQVHDQWFLRIT